ncbi:MAG: heavy metal translocating P-type ATPase [Halomonadaceae bacterium]|uniref:P-type Zn(2+) transporter n=1 Tax=Halomonas colorata TaxID=2742615 RepID=A0ABR9FUX8_9GAMM|nr:heavy metal translocating P-type ATPase [Halomonas colorata]MBE0462456.1 cadmium-translocating P-type ATPase [Halomonas colorata]
MSTSQHSRSDILTLHVQGMDCGGCERKVEAALSRLDNIHHVAASSISGTVNIVSDDKTRPNRQAVEEALIRLGYIPVTADSSQSSSPAWWQTPKGKLVLLSGSLLLLAWLCTLVWPAAGHWPFLATTLVGLIPIVQSAWRALRMRNPFTIEMLMSIAAVGALAIGALAEAAVVVFLFAVGELLEGVAATQARRRISALTNLTPSTARLLVDGLTREVAASTLMPGQHVVVRPGDRVPCDGYILSGESSIDESPVTGESVPRARLVDDDVFAGTINLDALITIEVTRRAEDNTIARIVRLVEEAQANKAPVARFIDRFAQIYMPAVVVAALLVALVLPLAFDMTWSESTYRALTLLLIACPCALVISTPAAIAAGLSSAARHGLLIKGGAVLEQLSHLKRVALDKTGTLTAGAPQVTDIEVATPGAETRLLRLAATLEQGANHPIATAITNHAQAQGIIPLNEAVSVRSLPGSGVIGHVDDSEVMLVSPRYLAHIGLPLDSWAERIQTLERQGESVALLIENQVLYGLIALRDEPREDALEGIQALKKLGVEVIMLSGDNNQTAQAIGEKLGLQAYGELMPDDKAQRVREWQAKGLGPVGKVGDGINDAPALAAAEIGIAMGNGTDIALETADAALLKNRVSGVAELIKLSRATLFNVKTNVALALGFKAVFLVSTLLGVTGMWVAVMADTGATVLVTLNAMRLLRYRF